MHVFGRYLNHNEPKSNAWAHYNCLNLVCYEWTQAQRPLIELYLVWKPKIVSWIILSPILEPIKGVYTWSTWKAKSSQDACPPSVSPSHFKQRPFHHNQGSSTPSLKWTKKEQVAQLCLTPHLVCNTPHLVCNIMVKLKVCLFIPCFYVYLNSKNPCSIWCTLFMYIYIF